MDFTRWLNKFVTLDTSQVITGLKKFGDAINHSLFESDGTLKFAGSATVWKDMNISTLGLSVGANIPDLINLDTTTIKVRAFDGGALTEELDGVMELQHDYKEGTDIIPHLHWYPTNANAGNVKWQLEYYLRQDNTVKLIGTTSIVSAASGIAWDETRASFPVISGATLTIGTQIHFRLFRVPTDAADTYASDAAVATFGVHYECDTVGSRQTTTK